MQITGEKGSVKNIKMQIDNYKELLFPIELTAGESLVSDGTEMVRVYDKNGKPKSTFKLSTSPPRISSGSHLILIDSDYPEDDSPKIEVQFKGLDKMENIEISKL
jgi:hypothetical protein